MNGAHTFPDARGRACVAAVIAGLLSLTCAGRETNTTGKTEVGKVEERSQGLHGYIGFSATRPARQSGFSAGMGFYSAVWPLIDQPLAGFQIGLAGTWITPDNADNKDKPLAPEGTRARTWRERGPTWDSVFQSNEALPDNRLGIAQLSNRLLIPPDALPFAGHPNGQFLGYAWMALPFTDATAGDPPTGDQSWTCFLSAANFKGPIAFYIPETWSKEKKAKMQALVEKIHAHWPIDRDYMAPPSRGTLVALDPALLVTPPKDWKWGMFPS